jgi:hypothetical protein
MYTLSFLVYLEHRFYSSYPAIVSPSYTDNMLAVTELRELLQDHAAALKAPSRVAELVRSCAREGTTRSAMQSLLVYALKAPESALAQFIRGVRDPRLIWAACASTDLYPVPHALATIATDGNELLLTAFAELNESGTQIGQTNLAMHSTSLPLKPAMLAKMRSLNLFTSEDLSLPFIYASLRFTPLYALQTLWEVYPVAGKTDPLPVARIISSASLRADEDLREATTEEEREKTLTAILSFKKWANALFAPGAIIEALAIHGEELADIERVRRFLGNTPPEEE